MILNTVKSKTYKNFSVLKLTNPDRILSSGLNGFEPLASNSAVSSLIFTAAISPSSAFSLKINKNETENVNIARFVWVPHDNNNNRNHHLRVIKWKLTQKDSGVCLLCSLRNRKSRERERESFSYLRSLVRVAMESSNVSPAMSSFWFFHTKNKDNNKWSR